LFEVGLTPRQLAPEDYHCIIDFGLGLTDLAKNISGMDDILSSDHFDLAVLSAKMRQYRPGVLAFTSKRAAEEFLGRPVQYGSLQDTIDATGLFVLPSPSGAARGHWNLQPWHDLARMRSATPNRLL
jgi:double-stranded uracil-DNA glycosylase